MKTLCALILALCLLIAPTVAHADSTQLSDKELNQTKQRLQAYERGLLTFEEISGAQNITNLPVITNIVFFYQNHSNEVTLKMLLPVSRCYMIMGKSSEAGALATKYLNVFSNDCRAWDILYASKAYEGSYDKAFEIGTNALALGCEKNLITLGMIALQTGHSDTVEKLVPRLLALKNKEADPPTKREMLSLLTCYSVITTNKQLFISALQGEKAKDLRPNRDLQSWVKKGCELFKAKETEQICKELIEK